MGARNWDSVSKWTEDTALAVLLKNLKAAHGRGLEHGISMPFNVSPPCCTTPGVTSRRSSEPVGMRQSGTKGARAGIIAILATPHRRPGGFSKAV